MEILTQKVWGNISKQFSTEALKKLQVALKTNDKRLIQGATCEPPPIFECMDFPVASTCLVAFCCVMDKGGFGKVTVGEVDEAFTIAIEKSNSELGPREHSYLLNWWDGTKREDAFSQLLKEVNITLEQREQEKSSITD